MSRLLFVALPLALAACSSEPSQQEGADDFANRIGQNESAAVDGTANPDKPNTANAQPPQGADLTQLQKLGDIGGVNLGTREGGCTLMIGKDEMIIAGGVSDRAIPGKAVVRIGDSLTTVDASVGGLDAVKSGATFEGEGFTVTVSPAEGDQQRRPANVLVRDAAGKSQSYSGNWICG